MNGSLAKQQFSGLFCNWKGIMIGRGEIWMNSDGKGPLLIVAINNNPSSDP